MKSEETQGPATRAGPADNRIVRYRGVSMRFMGELMEKLVVGVAAPGVELVVLDQDVNVDVPEMSGESTVIKAGTTVRMLDDSRWRVPYVGVFGTPPGANYTRKPQEKWTIEEVCEYVVLEATKEGKLFYLDLMDAKDVGERFQGAFISQARKSDFVDLVKSLLKRYEGADLTKQFVWLDVFSANQPLLTNVHNDVAPEDAKLFEGLLKFGLHDAIRQFDDRLIFFNSWLDAYPLQRAWCVWEIFGCAKSEKSLEILFLPGEEKLFLETLLDDPEDITRRIMDLRLEDASCFIEQDKRDIDAAVEKEIGYHSLNVRISNLLRKWLNQFMQTVIRENRPPSEDLSGKNGRSFCFLPFSRRQKFNGRVGDRKEGYILIAYQAGVFFRDQLDSFDESLAMLYECQRLEKRLYGNADNYQTAWTLHQIARTHKARGEHLLALKEFEKVLRIHEKIEGRNNENVADVLYDMANILLDYQMDNDKAIKLLQESLEITRTLENSSQQRSDLSAVLNSIGRAFMAKGDFQSAHEAFNGALQIDEKANGSLDHPNTAETLVQVAELFYEEEKYDAALTQLEKAMQIQEKAYGGRDSPVVQKTRFVIAKITMDNGDLDAALTILEECLEVTERAIGHDCLEVANVLHQMGLLWVEKGDFNKGLNLFQESFTIEQKVHGGLIYKGMEESLVDIGLVLEKKEQYEGALTSYKQAVKIAQELCLPEAEIEARFRVGHVLRAMGQPKQASKEYGKLVKFAKKHGVKSESVANALNQVGEILAEKGKLNQAVKRYREATEVHLASKHSGCIWEAALINAQIGTILDSQGKFKAAITCLEETLRMMEGVPDEEGDLQDVAHTRLALGDAFHHNGDMDAALASYELALKTFRAAYPDGHGDTGDALIRRAAALIGMDKLDQALHDCMEALALFEKLHPNDPSHENFGSAYFALGSVHLRREDYQSALPALLAASQIFEKLIEDDGHSDNSDQYASNLEELAYQIQQTIEKLAEAGIQPVLIVG